MADKYLVLQAGDTAINYNGGSRWFAADLTTPVTDPTSADNTIMGASAFPSASQSLVANSTAYCLSMDWTGALNTPTLNSSNVIYIYGNLITIADITVSFSAAGSFNFTGGGTHTLTSNGCLLKQVNMISNGGSITFIDDSNVGYLYQTYGEINTNNKTITATTVNIALANAKTLTAGSSTINCTSLTYSGSNLTVSANTATINVSGTGAVALGTADWNGASFNLTGTAHTVSGSPTGIATFTRTGTATKTDTVTFTSGENLTCGTFAMIGNSITNRLLVQSSTLGTPATITATNWTGSANVDIMDITVTNPVDLSAITGGSGDCQGNTDITFTTAAAQISAATGNWSTLATWQDGAGTDRVPLPQDDVTCSHSVTVDMPRIGKSITFTGTPTVTFGVDLSHYGSWTNVSGMTLTHAGKLVNHCGRGSYNIVSTGKTFYGNRLNAPSGTYTLQDNFINVNRFDPNAGTLNDGGNSVTLASFYTAGSITRALIMSGIWTLDLEMAASKWNLSSIANFSLTTTRSTIILTSSTANAQTFAGGGLTYNNVIVQGAGAYALTITGSNTFKSFKVDASEAAKTITGTAGTTQRIESFYRDPSKNVITLNSTGAAWTITGNSGYCELDYMNIANVTAGYTDIYYAGDNSTDSTGNTNWYFTRKVRPSWIGRW